MRELTVVEVRLDAEQGSPVLILKETGGERQVAIWMTAAGASAILGALQDADEDHPSSHELILSIVRHLGGEVSVAHIVGHQEGVFYAELIIDGRPVAARPSDAIAVALRAGVPIKIAQGVLDAVGVVPTADQEEAEAPNEDQVEQFRQFLDSVNPDDFEP
ncbi:bifunctional nuclease family protein [Micropruina sonneratiae]|uniref:bifunctional nuclease family protein n=1 Tax=Micropruina sonneratiae TaxID=2986940 RepID=UPI0022270873|nr:bifunctional nuclease family protein [Micropruina sp. KQZ13P-5]MCW3157779.1 bifunctional nuclease family protein [Micropruina sp. KQZ13P-5]